MLFNKPQKASAGWYDESWLYRQIVTITNSGSAQTDFQTMVTLDTAALYTAGKIQIDCDDIRITDLNGKLLPHWIEPTTCNTSTTKIWTKISSIATTGATLYVYYGNSSAASASSTTDTFVREISGVQGAWNMDEASWTNDCSTNTALDSSGNANHGKSCPNADGTQPAAGKFGNGGVFDGSNDYVDAGSGATLNTTNALTVEAWVYPNSFTASGGTNQRIVANKIDANNSYQLLSSSESRFMFQINVAGTAYPIKTSIKSINSWYHVVGVWDGANSLIYVNGILDSNSSAAQSTGTSGTLGAIIGKRFADNLGYLNGSIDDIHIYNRALSQSEITDLYGTGGDRQGYTTTNYPNKVLVRKYSASVSSGSPSGEERGPGPVAYWKFDEGYGQTANDSAFSNNGTLGATSGVESSDPTWQTEDMCVIGKCLKFDGVNDYVDDGDVLDMGTNNWTISAWIKHPSTSSYSVIIDKRKNLSGDDGYGYWITSAGKLQSYFGAANTNTYQTPSSSLTVADNNWHHVVTVYNRSGLMQQYIDGVADGSVSISAENNYDVQTDRYLQVGIGNGLNLGDKQYPFSGFIDDVKIYPYARTAAQIKNDYASRGSVQGVSASMGNSEIKWMTDGLVGYWKMDEVSWNGTAGEVIDASGTGNNGVAAGATHKPTTGAGKFGNGGSFDGIDDSIAVADSDSLEGMNALTISLWINPVSLTNIRGFVEKWAGGSANSYLLKYDSGYPGVVFYTYTTTGQAGGNFSGTSLNTNTWTHIVATYDGSIMKVYINGVPSLTTYNNTGNIKTNVSGGLNLGQDWNNNNFFNGSIDEARIYNRALSPKEVRDLYNYAPGPVGWWKMDDSSTGSGQTKADSSGYGNNGITDDGANNTGMNCAVQGKIGKACQFDGVDDYVDAGNGTNLSSSNFTYSFWMNKKGSSGGGWGGLIDYLNRGSQNSRILYSDSGSCILVQDAGVEKLCSTALSNNTWYYITLTFNGSTPLLYINGSLNKTGSASTFASGTNNILIGNGAWKSTYWFNGLIDDVRIYNYARTQKQIVEDMSARGGSASGGLAGSGGALAYYNFDEGQGITANNSGFGGSALNGTLTTMSAPATATSGWTDSGKLGKALNFDGNNDYIDAGTSAAFDTTDYTLSAWVYRKGSGRINNAIISRSPTSNTAGQYYLYILNSSNKLNMDIPWVKDNVITGTTVFAVNAWYHIVLTKSGTTYALYTNGVKENQVVDASVPVFSGSVKIGAVQNAYQVFNGTIDEVKVYNFALTEDEIKLDYNQGAATKLGSASTSSDGITADNSSSRAYCIPGDTSTCNPPVAYWNFDEKTGQSAYDRSGNANVGTLGSTASVDSNDPSWGLGKIGSALKFDGVDDYVDIGDVSNGNWSSLSTGAWIYWNGGVQNSYAGVYFKGYGSSNDIGRLLISAGGYVLVQNGNGDFISANNIQSNRWTYINYIYNQNTGQEYIYANGIIIGQKARTGNIAQNSNNLHIGWGDTTGSEAFYHFPGFIDDVRIYNYARTPAQIAWDYNQGKPVAEWKFDECQGNVANDTSGNGNNGTITLGASGQTTAGDCATNANTPWYNGRTGKFNSALNFDGTDDSALISDPNSKLDLTTNLTISAWVYPTGTPSGPLPRFTIFHKGGNSGIADPGGYSFVLYGANRQLEFVKLNVVEVFSTKTVPINEWHNVGVTYDGTNVRFYYDGSLAETVNNALAINSATTSNAYIGTYLYNPSLVQYFNGLIDDVKIYNYALTPLQVQTEYNQGAVNFR